MEAKMKFSTPPNDPMDNTASSKHAGVKLALIGFCAGSLMGFALTFAQMTNAVQHARAVSVELGCAAHDRDNNFYWIEADAR